MKQKDDRKLRVPPPRVFSLHARFTPTGPEKNDVRIFREFWLQAKGRTQDLRAKDLKRRAARLKALQAADRKTHPILLGILRNEIPPEEAGRKIRGLVRDKSLASELLDHWAHIVAATPESVAEQGKKIARDEANFCRLTRLGKAAKALHSSLLLLSEAAIDGDADAAEYLAEGAIIAVSLLEMAERSDSALFTRLARLQFQWPVLANEEIGWEKAAARRVADLTLGADLQVFKVRFRQARGADVNLPARLWAKAAVRVAEETRWRIFMLGQLCRDFGSSGAFADFCLEAGWDVGKKPKWSKGAAALPAFSRSSLSKWKPVVRQMIREEAQQFHERPEWLNQCRTATANGRDSVGEIQNAILDDIVSALASLAPDKPC